MTFLLNREKLMDDENDYFDVAHGLAALFRNHQARLNQKEIIENLEELLRLQADETRLQADQALAENKRLALEEQRHKREKYQQALVRSVRNQLIRIDTEFRNLSTDWDKGEIEGGGPLSELSIRILPLTSALDHLHNESQEAFLELADLTFLRDLKMDFDQFVAQRIRNNDLIVDPFSYLNSFVDWKEKFSRFWTRYHNLQSLTEEILHSSKPVDALSADHIKDLSHLVNEEFPTIRRDFNSEWQTDFDEGSILNQLCRDLFPQNHLEYDLSTIELLRSDEPMKIIESKLDRLQKRFNSINLKPSFDDFWHQCNQLRDLTSSEETRITTQHLNKLSGLTNEIWPELRRTYDPIWHKQPDNKLFQGSKAPPLQKIDRELAKLHEDLNQHERNRQCRKIMRLRGIVENSQPLSQKDQSKLNYKKKLTQLPQDRKPEKVRQIEKIINSELKPLYDRMALERDQAQATYNKLEMHNDDFIHYDNIPYEIAEKCLKDAENRAKKYRESTI